MTGDFFEYRVSARKDSTLPERIVAAVGVFDGVHLGHRRIVDAASKLAAETGAVPVALTFDPHPREVVDPANAPRLLLPLPERVRLLLASGVAEVRVARFNAAFAALSPQEFLERLWRGAGSQVCGLAVGENWRFGARGAGDCALLKQECAAHGAAFAACPLLQTAAGPVSSSAIRSATANGELDAARAMQGRPVALYGSVTGGHRAAGSVLKHPTANLKVEFGVLPPDGVYAAAAVLPGGERFAAAVNIGFAPTFGWQERERRVEAHLLDFDGDLYDTPLKLELFKFLRAERAFASPEELRTAIGHDTVEVKAVFSLEQ
ncbi:MAG: riboflavin biosynthesis protein RibF [Victivallaceae bacterium]|nr:riboflavin biosynthesis protein RibF [Victivallaceae bacterium]